MKNNNYKINLVNDRPIIDILSNVCWQLRVNNFENKIGKKKETVEILLRRLIKEEQSDVIETYLDRAEVEIIRRAFIVVKEEIEEWEFQTLFGVFLNEVEEMPILKNPID